MSRRGYDSCTPSQAEQRHFSAPTKQSRSRVYAFGGRIEHDCYIRCWSYLVLSSLRSPLHLCYPYPYPKGALFDDYKVSRVAHGSH